MKNEQCRAAGWQRVLGLPGAAPVRSKAWAFGLALLLVAVSVQAEVAGGDSTAEATQLTEQVDLLFQQGWYAEAVPLATWALEISEKIYGAEHPSTGTRLNDLALLYKRIGRYELALPLFQRALVISEKANGLDHTYTGVYLNNLASMYLAIVRYDQALPLVKQALTISEKANGPDHPSTGTSLNILAGLYQAMGRYEQALPLYERTLAISERARGPEGQRARGPEHLYTAVYLTNLGRLYYYMGRYEKAQSLYQRTLAIREKAEGQEHPNTGMSLNNLATLYLAMGRYEQAMPLALRALAISEKAEGQEHPSTGESLDNLVTLYQAMGRYEQAMPLAQRSLAIKEKASLAEHPKTAASLSYLAGLYQGMGRYGQALPLAQRALAINEKALGPDHPNTGTCLHSLAMVYRAMARYEQALPLFQRALLISEKVVGPEHPDTGWILANLAKLYQDMGRYEQALPLLQRALRVLALNAQSPIERAIATSDLADLQSHLSRPDQAIYWGKQAVNGLQRVRANFSGLNKDLQHGFLKKHEGHYTALASRLVDAGRLAEAQQVTAMLKEQELFELVRRDAAADPRASEASFTGIETPLQQQYEAITRDLAAAGQALEALQRKARYETLSPEEQINKAGFEAQLKTGQAAFERYLSSLEAAFAKVSNERRKDIERLNLAEAQALQSTLDELGHGAVLLHYIVLDDQFKIILTTPTIQRGYTVQVGQTALNKAINALREGIERRANVQPSAKQLYDWLISPVQADLDTAGTQTVMLALTDSLRYLPFAALHDGKQWLAERYALAMYTEAARDKIAKASNPKWQLQAFGVSRQIPGFKALPAVKAELASITGSQGIPGQSRLDEQFTAAALQSAVDARPPVIHVASHFVFRPGTEVDSFLLLGDGSRLMLADIKGYSFRQLDLLTLSACETALGGGQNENGREIEGFGALAQKRGAGAVLATLWPVADDSTAQFMQRFYTTRQSKPGMSKAEAIRQAQVALIEGRRDALVATAAGPADGQTERQASRPAIAAQPALAVPVDLGKPFTHPYFWAPFVLMGNWL